MYIIADPISGNYLTTSIVLKMQKKGVLSSSDFPAYDLNMSLKLFDDTEDNIAKKIQKVLNFYENKYRHYVILSPLASDIADKIEAKLTGINLFNFIENQIDERYQYGLFTNEYNLINKNNVIHYSHDDDILKDLAQSATRGYDLLGIDYSATPMNLTKKIYEYYTNIGCTKFVIASSHMHQCKSHLMALGVEEDNIIDIVDIAADKIIELHTSKLSEQQLDKISDEKTRMRYKYLTVSDAPAQDLKNNALNDMFLYISNFITNDKIAVLDIGSSSVNTGEILANMYPNSNFFVKAIDSSERSVQEAKRNSKRLSSNLQVEYECCDIRNMTQNKPFDIILCLGVLLCFSSDTEFEQIVANISNMIVKGGLLIVRDSFCINLKSKQYMSWGGVIRNFDYYNDVMSKNALTYLHCESVMLSSPERDVKTIVFQKGSL